MGWWTTGYGHSIDNPNLLHAHLLSWSVDRDRKSVQSLHSSLPIGSMELSWVPGMSISFSRILSQWSRGFGDRNWRFCQKHSHFHVYNLLWTLDSGCEDRAADWIQLSAQTLGMPAPKGLPRLRSCHWVFKPPTTLLGQQLMGGGNVARVVNP